jgi:hypothetical protein
LVHKKVVKTANMKDTKTGITGYNCVPKSPGQPKFDPMNKSWKQPGRGKTAKPTGKIPDYKNQYDGR